MKIIERLSEDIGRGGKKIICRKWSIVNEEGKFLATFYRLKTAQKHLKMYEEEKKHEIF